MADWGLRTTAAGDVRSMLCVRLYVDEDNLGALNLYFRRVNGFDASQQPRRWPHRPRPGGRSVAVQHRPGTAMNLGQSLIRGASKQTPAGSNSAQTAGRFGGGVPALLVVCELRAVCLGRGPVMAGVRPIRCGQCSGSEGCRVSWHLEELFDAGRHVALASDRVASVGCIVSLVGISKQLLLSNTPVGKGLNTCVDTLLERFKGGFALV